MLALHMHHHERTNVAKTNVCASSYKDPLYCVAIFNASKHTSTRLGISQRVYNFYFNILLVETSYVKKALLRCFLHMFLQCTYFASTDYFHIFRIPNVLHFICIQLTKNYEADRSRVIMKRTAHALRSTMTLGSDPTMKMTSCYMKGSKSIVYREHTLKSIVSLLS